MCRRVNKTAHCSEDSPQARVRCGRVGGISGAVNRALLFPKRTFLQCDLPPAHSAGATLGLKRKSIFSRLEHDK